MTQPWERQPGETLKQYAAFEWYRRLEPHNRAVDRAYRMSRAVDPNDRRIRNERWAQWATKNQWIMRASAWDEHVRQVERQAELDAATERAKLRIGGYQNLVVSGLQILRNADLATLTPDQARRLLNIAIKAIETGGAGGRVEDGQPSERIAYMDEVRKLTEDMAQQQGLDTELLWQEVREILASTERTD